MPTLFVYRGYPALAQEPMKKKKKDATHEHLAKPVELFKLYLAPDAGGEMPPLPPGLDFKRAITDYLGEMAKVWLTCRFDSNDVYIE